MKLAGTVKIDSTGLESSGTANATINFEGISYDSIYAEYNNDFRLGFYPFQIRKGQVDFYYEQQRIAYADGSGFHPDWSSFGDAFVPEKIPLPTEEIAYIKIKENDQLLVNIRDDGMGNTVVSTKPGQPVQLFVPALQSDGGPIPQIAVDFNDLVLDGSNGSVVGGSVVATVPDDDPAFDLRQRGIPITPKQIAFGVDEQGDVNVTGLFIKGNLSLFNKDLGQPASVVVGIQSDGHLRGAVNLQGINASVPMLALKDYVHLNFKNITGSIDIPLLAATPNPYFDINFDSDFQIFNANDSLVVGAVLSARYRPNDLSITDFNASVNQESATIYLDPFSIGIESLNNLSISYTRQEGFNFTTAIDCTFGYQLSNGTNFEFPLKNVELGSLNGFTIPAQDIHEGSWPGFDPPAVDFGVFRLQPLAFRLPAVNINWFSQSVNIGAFDPKVDLELSFPQLQYDAPEFSQSTFTFNDIGFDHGVLTGSMLPFTFPGDGVFVPIGGDLGINVKEIAGLLEFASDSLQGFDINLKGKLKYPDFMKNEGVCTQTQVSLNIDRNAHFTGVIEDFTPCGKLKRGPLTLQFNNSELSFDVSASEQSASLSGSATALIERSGNNAVNATGNVALDLINGKLINGSILLTGPFEWQYTNQDSLFAFTVQTAKLDTTGLIFTGNGSLQLGNGSSNLAYNDLTFSLNNGKLIDGSVLIKNEFALDVALNPVAWSVENPAVPTTNDPGLRLTMPANLLMDKNGLTVSDSSVASLSYDEQHYELLKVNFDNFNMGVDPVQVKSGRADFFLDSLNGSDPVRIAYYDQTGFHLDDGTSLIKAVLPDTLYLPTEEVGYIVLRDQNGDLKVDIESVAQGKKINTQAPLPMVVSAFDPSDPMTMDVRIYDLIINDAFEVVQGYIESDLSSNPINLLPTENVPLQLTKIAYLKDGNNPYSLFVDATLVLPKSLNDVEVKMEKLELGPGGFKSALVKAGVYSTTYDPNQPTLVDHSFSQGEFQFAVSGVELDFDQSGNAYRMSGQLGSSIFKDENGNNSVIHYAAQYSTGVGWEFDLDAHHLPQMKIPIDKAKMILDNLDANFDDTKFELVIDSRLTFDDVMGDDFEITVNDFKVGTNGISVDNINTNAVQYLSLFNQTDNLELTDLGISFENSILYISLDGSLNFMERDLDFTALKVGTDGSIALDGLNANLLTQDFEILGQYLVLKEIGLTTLNGKIALTAGGEVNMPEPFEQSDNALAITVNYQGQADVQMPSLTATNVPDVDLGGFAILDMTEVGIDFDPMDIESTAFFASADLNIPDDKNGGVNTIEFGSPNGDINAAGIYYRYSDNDINWQITNSPDFSFDQTFFKLSIENISAGSSGGFRVTMDADASLQFEQVGGGGRMEGITIDKTGVDWGTFAGANFTFIDFVNIEVGSFEYFSDGGSITLEKGSGNGPESSEVSEESIYVDEYLNFSNPTGNALSISIGDPDGFSVSGGIESIIYYKKGDELYFNMKGATIELHDMARLYASVEYQRNDTGFLLRVAGSALITPPGSEIGVVAVGKLANINDQFSMGIFVATKGVPIPIIPAIVEINKFGGGFFYHAESADLNLVTEATDYDPYKEDVPWESSDRTFDFAIIFYGGIGVIGTTNNYTLEGEMMMVIASDFLLIDSRFEMNTAPLEGGAYFSMDFQSDRFVLEAGGGMQLKDLGVVKGGLGVNFTAIKYKNQDNLQWAFTGGTTVAGGTPITIVGILEANATVVVSNDGFLLDCSVEAGFDIWIVSVDGGLEATVWYLAQQKQFGVYAEVHIEASVLGGLAKLGGNAKGALIIEKGDFLIYASLTGYVEVAFVFEGDMTAWISIQNSGFDAGLGKSGYEDMIEEARRNAQKLNEKAESLISSIEDAKNAIIPLSNETLAKSGQALFMASDQVRESWGNDFIQNEQRLKSPVPQAFQDMRDEVVDGNRPEDNKRNIMLYHMKNAIQEVNDNSADVLSELQKLKASAIEWEAQSENMVANLQDPVQKQMDWQGDMAPSFGVDTIQSATNTSESEGLKQTIDQFSDEAFQAAIDTTLMNIHKIEKGLDGRRYSLASSPPTFDGPSLPDMPEGNETENNVLKMAHRYADATGRVRRYYGTQISYFWALYHWAKNKVDNYDQMTTFYKDGPLGQANKAVTDALGITYSGPLYGSYYNVTMGGIQIVSGSYRVDWNPTTWNDLSSSQKATFKGGLTKSISTVSDAIGQRRYLIQKMNPDIDEQAAQSSGDELENSVKNYWNQNNFYDFINALNASSDEIKQMHLLGLEAIRDMAYDKADSLVDAADQVLNDLDQDYEHFTSIQNDVYQIKHSMLVSLYGMYDLYSGWKENDEDASYYINQKMDELETILNPPRINKIGLVTNRGDNGYDRELLIGWNSFHPYNLSTGNIESSYNIQQGNSNSIYARGFKSTGQDEGMYFNIYAKDDQAQSQDLTIRIRVRGPGGNTVTRFINTNVALAPDAGEESTSDFNLLEEDTSPPTAPIVSFNYKKNQPPGFTEKKYWSNDLRSMSIGIVAFDNESDIAKVEYAIGSTKGGTDIVDWKEGQATNNIGGNNSLGNAAKTIVARNMNLEVGKDYYVSARVINGAGKTSPVTEQSTPLRLDVDIPSDLTEELVFVSNPIMVPFILPGFGYAANFVTETPTLQNPPAPVNGNYPKVDVSWNAGQDSLSGIYQYEYVVSHESNPIQALETEALETNSRFDTNLYFSGEPLNFTDTTYIHVWAKDYAGNKSKNPLTFARLPKDDTGPVAPKATIMTTPDGLRLFIKKPSYDPESRVKGFQYAVGTTPYGTDIKSWPQDNTLDDLEMSWGNKLILSLWRAYVIGDLNNNWNGTYDAPFYEIPPTAVPEGQQLYISYRTVNGQGMISGASGTGPVVLDTSAPPSPGMSLTFNSGQLEIKATQLKDDQSGIAKVEYVVKEKYGSYNPYLQWNDLLTINGVRTTSFDYIKTVSWGNMPSQTQVGIRLTNGNGMQSTYWYDGSQYGVIKIDKNPDYPPISGFDFQWN